MSVRVSPTGTIKDQVGARIGTLVEDGHSITEVIEELAQLGAQLLIQTALEGEIDEFLGRDRYQRVVKTPEARPGMRNGYQPITVKTTTGREATQARRQARLFAAIRRDAATGLSKRALAARHQVTRRTINQALTSSTPPVRKKHDRPAFALNPVRDHLDTLISQT